MKNTFAIAVGTAVLLAAGMPLAQNTKAPASNPTPTATQSGQPMNMGGQMRQMDEHIKKMQALHDKMTSATPPEERQKLMDEQRSEMQACMAMMTPMMQGGGMMGGMGGGAMGQQGKPADTNMQMQMMQKRMDMMQMMMQTMMDQQGMMAGPKPMATAPKT
jgi:hypothetical protein